MRGKIYPQALLVALKLLMLTVMKGIWPRRRYMGTWERIQIFTVDTGRIQSLASVEFMSYTEAALL